MGPCWAAGLSGFEMGGGLHLWRLDDDGDESLFQ